MQETRTYNQAQIIQNGIYNMYITQKQSNDEKKEI